MDFGRLDVLSKEIDIINAILNGDNNVSFNSLYEKDSKILRTSLASRCHIRGLGRCHLLQG